MGMVAYQLYLSSLGTAATLTATAKGKIVAIGWSVEMLGGAAVGTVGLNVIKNGTPVIANTFALNNPQKNLTIFNAVFRCAITTAFTDSGFVTGIGIDYQAGDTFNAILNNITGTVPTEGIAPIVLYCVEA